MSTANLTRIRLQNASIALRVAEERCRDIEHRASRVATEAREAVERLDRALEEMEEESRDRPIEIPLRLNEYEARLLAERFGGIYAPTILGRTLREFVFKQLEEGR